MKNINIKNAIINTLHTCLFLCVPSINKIFEEMRTVIENGNSNLYE